MPQIVGVRPKKRKMAVHARKLNASKCIVNALGWVNNVDLNVHAINVVTHKNIRILSRKLGVKSRISHQGKIFRAVPVRNLNVRRNIVNVSMRVWHVHKHVNVVTARIIMRIIVRRSLMISIWKNIRI